MYLIGSLATQRRLYLAAYSPELNLVIAVLCDRLLLTVMLVRLSGVVLAVIKKITDYVGMDGSFR